MLIRSILVPKQKLSTFSSDSTVKTVLDTIESKGFLSAPVVDGDRYIGMVSKVHLYETFIRSNTKDFETFSQTPVGDYVEHPIEPVQETLFVEEAADIFFRQPIRFLPVVSPSQSFLGIVTQKSLFSVITKVYGLRDAKIVIHSADFIGSLSKIFSIIEKSDVNVSNIAQFDTEVMGIQEISIRVVGRDLPKLVDRLKEKGVKVKEFIPAKS